MSNPVLFYFDFSSPYGYFAAQKIDETVADFGRRVTWKPIMLGSALKETARPARSILALSMLPVARDVRPGLSVKLAAPIIVRV